MKQGDSNAAQSMAINFGIGGIIIIVMSLAYLRFTPPTYSSTAIIGLSRWVTQKAEDKPKEERLTALECNRMLSKEFMDSVAVSLDLKKNWNLISTNQQAPSPEIMRLLLRSKVAIHPIPGSLSIEITSRGAKGKDCALIANTFATNFISAKEADITGYLTKVRETFQRRLKTIETAAEPAQKEMDRLYIAIQKERLGDTNHYYDANSYDALLRAKLRLEKESDLEAKELSRLKGLSEEDLKQSLTTGGDNEVLTGLLVQLSKVQSKLVGILSDSGADSPDAKKMIVIKEDLNKKIEKQIHSILKMKSTELEGTQEALEKTKQELLYATTNVPASSLLYSNYLAAKSTVETSQEIRTNIISEFVSFGTNFALGTFKEPLEDFSLNYRGRLIEEAVTPYKPSSPDPQLAKVGVGTGILSLVISIFCLLVSRRKIVSD